MIRRRKRSKKYKFYGKALEFLHSIAEVTVLITSRGFGKSVVASYAAAKLLAKGRSGVIMAPTYADVKGNILKNICAILESQGFIEKKHFFIDHQIKELTLLDRFGNVLSVCSFRSCDNPDCARGITDASWLLIDEAALCSKEAFDATLPVLRGEGVTDIQIFLTTSPRGIGNWVSVMASEPDVNLIQASVYDCTWMTEEQRNKFIETNRKRHSKLFFEQEVMGAIIDINADSVYGTADIESLFSQHEFVDGDIIAGLDIGRKGDPCVLSIRRGNRIEHIEQKFDMLTMDDIKNWIGARIRNYPGIKRFYIDETGLGQYVPPALSSEFPSIEFIGVNFGAKETKPGYFRKRSEIFYDLKRLIQENGLHFSKNIDRDLLDETRRELCSIEYTIGAKGEFKVVEKEVTKKTLGRSPDLADSLALMCHTSSAVSRELVDNALKRLSKPKKYYNNKKG